MELQDSYKSIQESLIHGGVANEVKVNVISIHSEHISANNIGNKMQGLHGILVAPGFGERGIEGNSHMMMMDRNSDQIADLIVAWLDAS